MYKDDYMISLDVVKQIAYLWSSAPNEECLMDIYGYIKGKEGIRPNKLTLEILSDLFNFSNALVYVWKNQVSTYTFDGIVTDMIVMDGGMLNAARKHIEDTSPVLVSLINMRSAVTRIITDYSISPVDWDFIMGLDILDPCKRLYILMYGFRERDKTDTSLGWYKKNAMEMYGKVGRVIREMMAVQDSPTFIADQSASLATCSKILGTIHEALLRISEFTGDTEYTESSNGSDNNGNVVNV